MSLTKVTFSMVNSTPVNVRDYGAVGDGITDDTAAALAALAAAKLGSKCLYFPKGNYLVQQPLQLDGGITAYGDGITATQILRTSLASVQINGEAVYAVFYVAGGWNHIHDMSITGVIGSTTGTVSGIQYGISDPAYVAAKGSVKNVAINFMLHGIVEKSGVFLTEFKNIQTVSCGYGFDFFSSNQKTSLTFSQCYAANTGPAYRFNVTNYSSMDSCAADNCNWGTKPANPYGIGFGSPASDTGVYHFNQSDFTLNSIGSEGSYGNGVISASSSVITLDNMYSFDCKSEYVPNYVAYPNYAVGPIQTTTAANRLTICNATNLFWANSAVASGYPSKPIADLVAFNYDEASLGVINNTQVFLACNPGVSPVVKGMGPISKNVRSTYSDYKTPVFDGNITNGSYGVFVKSVVVSGTGTKLTIPVTSQAGQNYKHLIKLSGIDGTTNSASALPFQATFAFGGTTAPTSVTSTGLWNVSSVGAAGAGSAIEVTISASRTNPIVNLEIISEVPSLIDTANMTIT